MANSPMNSKRPSTVFLEKVWKKVFNLTTILVMTTILCYIIINVLDPVTVEFKGAIVMLSFILSTLLLNTANRNEWLKEKDECNELLKRDVNKLLEENINLTHSLKQVNRVVTIQKEKEEIILEKIELMTQKYDSLKKSYENIHSAHNKVSDLHKEEVKILIKIAQESDPIKKINMLNEYQAFSVKAMSVYKELQDNM